MGRAALFPAETRLLIKFGLPCFSLTGFRPCFLETFPFKPSPYGFIFAAELACIKKQA
jgi:hypothetical protein